MALRPPDPPVPAVNPTRPFPPPPYEMPTEQDVADFKRELEAMKRAFRLEQQREREARFWWIAWLALGAWVLFMVLR